MKYFDFRRDANTRFGRLNGSGDGAAGGPLGSCQCEDRGRSTLAEPAAPLRDQAKRNVYSRYRRGESVQSLARRFHRTPASVGRLIGMMRARRIMGLPLTYIASGEFAEVRDEAWERAILGPVPPGPPEPHKRCSPRELPSYLAGLYKIPSLARVQEVHLFRKMNYLKWKASRLREQLDLARPKKALMDRIEQLCDEAVVVKNAIVSANLRLVVSIAKHYVDAGNAMFELISDGNMALIRAVEEFDYGWGTEFRTYATRVIRASLAEAMPALRRCADRSRAGRGTASEQEWAPRLAEERFGTRFDGLESRETRNHIESFGLAHGRQPRTTNEGGGGSCEPAGRAIRGPRLAPARRQRGGDLFLVRCLLFLAMVRRRFED